MLTNIAEYAFLGLFVIFISIVLLLSIASWVLHEEEKDDRFI